MRKILLTLFMVLCAVASAFALEVTFTPVGSWNSTAGAQTETKDGVTIATTSGVGSTEYRIYKGATFTVTSTVGNITSIQFTCTANNTTKYGPGCFTAASGAYTYEGKVGTWTGSATSATFTASSNQVRAEKIVVTVSAADVVASPVFSVKAGTYYEAQSVAITNPNTSGTVYYTTDGNEPTAASTAYTAAIDITTNTTIKAIVVDGDKTSEVVTAEYVIAAPEGVDNIAAFLAKADDAVVKFNNPVTAVYQAGAYLYAQDESGVMLIYGSAGQTYNNGDVIPAGFYGTKVTYSGLVELSTDAGDGSSTESFAASTQTVDPINAAVASIADITADSQNKYFFLENVTFNASAKTLSDGTNILNVFNRFSGMTLPASGTYDVYGFAAVNAGKTQIFPTEFISKLTVDNIAAYVALGDGAKAKFNNPVTVAAIYKTSSGYTNYYVVDATGGMIIYGKTDEMPVYKEGDVIPAGFSGLLDMYYDKNPELTSPEGLTESTATAEVPVTTYAVEEISADMVGTVVKINAATIKDVDKNNFNIEDETGTIAGYNKFGKTLKAGSNIIITGIIAINRTGNATDGYTYTTQVLPIDIDYSAGVDAVDGDSQVSVHGGKGEIVVQGNAKRIDVFTVGGERTTTVKGTGDYPDEDVAIESAQGFYIVVVDGVAHKVIVK